MMKKPASCSFVSANGPSWTLLAAVSVEPQRRRRSRLLQSGADDHDAGVLQRLHVRNEARPEGLVPFRIVARRELLGRRIEEKGMYCMAWSFRFSSASIVARTNDARAAASDIARTVVTRACPAADQDAATRPSPAPRCRTRSPCRRSNRNPRSASTARASRAARRARRWSSAGAGVAHGLAGIDRLQPFQVPEAGRGAELRPRSRAVPAPPSAVPVATLHFIQAEAVCQPDAQSPPNTLFLAASSSTWKGCGSYLRAKALIASGLECVASRARRCRRGGRTCRASLRRLAGQEHAGVLQLEHLLAALVERVRCGW